MTEKELYQQWLEHATEDADLQTELKGIAGDDAAISDRFYRDLNSVPVVCEALSVQAPIV